MSTNILPPTPTIKVIFKGFVITHIVDGATWAELSALRTSPCHKPKVKITEITPAGEPIERTDLNIDPSKGFTLSVSNVSDEKKGIRVFQKDSNPFNRLDGENVNRDFRWFVDLPMLFGKEALTVDATTLAPVFKMNNALFYTNTLSPGEMRLKPSTNDPSRRFGRFALEVGANIYLDRPDSIAILNNGAQKLFEVDKASPTRAQTRYVVEFDCNCHVDVEESDFPLVFDVIGASLTNEEKKLTLEGDPFRLRPDLTPEVYCVGGNVRP